MQCLIYQKKAVTGLAHEMKKDHSKILVQSFNPLTAGILIKIDYVGTSRAQRAPSPSGFSYSDSVETPINLWDEPLETVFT